MRYTRKKRGGARISTKQIMLNTPMRAALEKYNRTRNANGRFRNFKTDLERVKREGFYPIIPRLNTVGTLSRMEGNNSVPGILRHANFNTFLEENPVKLKATARVSNPNGTKTTLYQVMDGRHRVVRAILNGKEEIPFVEA